MSRGFAFAAAALALAVSAHVLGGGSVPDPIALTFLSLPLVWVCFFLTRARRRWPVVIGSLVAVEIGLHEGLSLLSGQAPGGAFRAGSDAHASMGAHGSAMSSPAMLPPSAEGMTEMAAQPGLSMIAAHVAATVLSGAVLAYGEHLLWQLWMWLRLAITIPAAAVRLPLAARDTPAWLPTANPVPAVVDRSVRRRGPPSGQFRVPVSC